MANLVSYPDRAILNFMYQMSSLIDKLFSIDSIIPSKPMLCNRYKKLSFFIVWDLSIYIFYINLLQDSCSFLIIFSRSVDLCNNWLKNSILNKLFHIKIHLFFKYNEAACKSINCIRRNTQCIFIIELGHRIRNDFHYWFADVSRYFITNNFV